MKELKNRDIKQVVTRVIDEVREETKKEFVPKTPLERVLKGIWPLCLLV